VRHQEDESKPLVGSLASQSLWDEKIFGSPVVDRISVKLIGLRPRTRHCRRVSLCLGVHFCKDPMAETVGFEPTVSFPTHDFQSCRFGRSRTSPTPRADQEFTPGRPRPRQATPALCARPPGSGRCRPPGRSGKGSARSGSPWCTSGGNIVGLPGVGCDGWVLRNVLL
jgi:hypothetical protein